MLTIRRFLALAFAATTVFAATAGSAVAHHYDHLLAREAKCPGQTDPSLSSGVQERIMRCMHNHARTKVGRRALRASTLLQASTDRKTADMIRCGFSHYACGRTMNYWMRWVGYPGCSWYGGGRWGENIAWLKSGATI